MPTMTIRKDDTEYQIPIAGWDNQEIIAISTMYEGDGYEVTTGKI